MKPSLLHDFKRCMLEFAAVYHKFRVEQDQLSFVRYKIASTLQEFKKTNKLELTITDRPGDILPPMTLNEIKSAKDILACMHPIDVNSINDLYYLSRDMVSEIRISGNKIIVVDMQGTINEYDVNKQLDLTKILPTRVSYIIGHMQAEKLLRDSYKEKNRYKIIADNITSLQVTDLKTNQKTLKNPIDVLFSEEYKLYTKEDIAKIGYICGQMTKLD